MSTILKALQRLEDEKSANVERSLDEQVVAHRPPPDPERRGLKFGAAAIGGLAVAAAALLFWFTRGDPDAEVAVEPPPAAAPEVEQPVAAEKPRSRPSGRPVAAARAQRNSSEVEVSPIVEVVEHLDPPPADPDAPAAARERAAQRRRAAAQAKAGAERPARRPRARSPEPQVAREAAQSAPARERVGAVEPPAIPIAEHSAPSKPAPAPPEPVEIAAAEPKPAATEISASIPAAIREPEKKVVPRAKLPALRIEKTIWHPDAERRIAVLKLADAEEVLRLKEGDAVGPLVIEAIEPGAVLFNHDGVEIRYNVGG